ncbi:MAG: hypothetical protein K0S33_1797 [Bacteroidetes bacterium]|jgi:hypothetical protein|nr:hypothetical protein [Bacteroidota bacterium]
MCLFFCFLCFFSQAQEPADSLANCTVKDSLQMYKKIKSFMYKRKFTRLVYDAVFRDPEPKEYPKAPETAEKNVNPYLVYNGFVIQKIQITVYDPFGFSLTDTSQKDIKRIERWGNKTHIRTRKWVINNKLLFKESDTINALVISETERLLRAAPYVNDAKITMFEQGCDSVIVNVVVHDKWAITIPAELTDVTANARFRNYNMMGLGQQFEQYARFKRPDDWYFSGFYTIANLDNTYISSTLAYSRGRDGTAVSLNFDRPFFSPLAKWAGGLTVGKNWNYYFYTDPATSEEKKTPADNAYYDAWLGKSFKLSKERTLFNQSTNIIASVRYYNSLFQRVPDVSVAPAYSYRNSWGVLANVGLAVQQYYKDQYVYRFGSNEDVPEGFIGQLVYGIQEVEPLRLRHYIGFEIARAKHFNFGYLTGTYAQGVFFNRNISNDATYNAKLYYFSNLLRSGRWYFRQFVNYNFLHGENKQFGAKITLSGDELYGFTSGSLNGNTKMLMNLETIAYAPYKLIGFKFAPAFLAGYGIMGDPQNKLTKSRLYQGYSIALMIRNENLLNSTFQVSVGLYPFLPDHKDPVLKYNPVTSFTLRVRPFVMGRPEFVGY